MPCRFAYYTSIYTPKIFDLFQDLKYNYIAKYEDLKDFYRYKSNNPQATQKDYKCVTSIRQLVVKGNIHIPQKWRY